jgi:hypothetical protein
MPPVSSLFGSQFFSTQITVGTGGSRLTQLIGLNINASERNQPTVTEMSIQVDGSTAGTLFIGDINISGSRYGIALISPGGGTASPIKQYGGDRVYAVPVVAIALISSVNGLLVNISWRLN